ncbi:hypothetical protein CPB86DRAFT_783456 [Serendipita vermifera]|nr:hypothetical protein CPB86DRAFT_783456 [Serendipita vermifera]
MDTCCTVTCNVLLQVCAGFCTDLASVRHNCTVTLCKPCDALFRCKDEHDAEEPQNRENEPLLPSGSRPVTSQPSENGMKVPS